MQPIIQISNDNFLIVINGIDIHDLIIYKNTQKNKLYVSITTSFFSSSNLKRKHSNKIAKINKKKNVNPKN